MTDTAHVDPQNPAARPRRYRRRLGLLFSHDGAVGIFLHFRANVEFQTEVDSSIRGMAHLVKAMRAKAPPVLAPSAMIQLGLIGLAYTFKYPMKHTLPILLTRGLLGAE